MTKKIIAKVDSMKKRLQTARHERYCAEFQKKYDGLPVEAVTSLPYEEQRKIFRREHPIRYVAEDIKRAIRIYRATHQYEKIPVRGDDYTLAMFEKNLGVLMPGYVMWHPDTNDDDCFERAYLIDAYGRDNKTIPVFIESPFLECRYREILNRIACCGKAVVIGYIDSDEYFEIDEERITLIDEDHVDDLDAYYEYVIKKSSHPRPAASPTDNGLYGL